jgi:hypothetical protein
MTMSMNAAIAMAQMVAAVTMGKYLNETIFIGGCGQRSEVEVDYTHSRLHPDEQRHKVKYHPMGDAAEERVIFVTLQRWYGGGWIPLYAEVYHSRDSERKQALLKCVFDSEGKVIDGFRFVNGKETPFVEDQIAD